MDNNKNIKLAELLYQYMQNDISKEDQAYVEMWMEDQANKKYYNKLKNTKFEPQPNFNKSNVWLNIDNQIKKGAKTRLFNTISVAASIIIIFTVSIIFIKTNKVNTVNITQETSIQPGVSKAVLITSKGKQITLDNISTIIDEVDGKKLELENHFLKYKTITQSQTKKQVYNTLVVPRNREFSIQLSDGTKVWLNADTELKYPLEFIGNKRVVYLKKGEAFFDVAKNKTLPFIVNTPNNSNIKVLGTQFNVNTYKSNVITTLVEGSVQINKENHSTMLVPGEQAIVNEEISKHKVDVEYYTAWKEGYFIYKDEKLGDILEELARWYDFNIFYMNNSIANEVFTARMKKYTGIKDILNLLEQTGKVKFEINNKSILVKRNFEQ